MMAEGALPVDPSLESSEGHVPWVPPIPPVEFEDQGVNLEVSMKTVHKLMGVYCSDLSRLHGLVDKLLGGDNEEIGKFLLEALTAAKTIIDDTRWVLSAATEVGTRLRGELDMQMQLDAARKELEGVKAEKEIYKGRVEELELLVAKMAESRRTSSPGSLAEDQMAGDDLAQSAESEPPSETTPEQAAQGKRPLVFSSTPATRRRVAKKSRVASTPTPSGRDSSHPLSSPRLPTLPAYSRTSLPHRPSVASELGHAHPSRASSIMGDSPAQDLRSTDARNSQGNLPPPNPKLLALHTKDREQIIPSTSAQTTVEPDAPNTPIPPTSGLNLSSNSPLARSPAHTIVNANPKDPIAEEKKKWVSKAITEAHEPIIIWIPSAEALELSLSNATVKAMVSRGLPKSVYDILVQALVTNKGIRKANAIANSHSASGCVYNQVHFKRTKCAAGSSGRFFRCAVCVKERQSCFYIFNPRFAFLMRDHPEDPHERNIGLSYQPLSPREGEEDGEREGVFLAQFT